MIKLILKLPQVSKSHLIKFYRRTQYISNFNTHKKRPSLQQDVVAPVAQDAPFFI